MTAGFTAHSGLRPEAKRYVMAGRGVVVDAGGRGDFTTVQDACDYMAARSLSGRVWIRAGTYNEAVTTTTSNADLTIEGESHDVLVDGTTVGHAFSVLGARTTIRDLSCQTTGGEGNAYRGMLIGATAIFSLFDRILVSDADDGGIVILNGAVDSIVSNCWVSGCDGDGIYTDAQRCLFHGNTCNSNGSDGLAVGATGDNTRFSSNLAHSNSAYGILIDASGENCTYVGNRCVGNSSGQIQDNSGTSTGAGNDTT